MYNLDAIFDDIGKYALVPQRDDEVSLTELFEKDPEGRTKRQIRTAMDKLVKSGKYTSRLAGGRVRVYSVVSEQV